MLSIINDKNESVLWTKIESPIVPRYRRAPRRVDSGSTPHQFSTPKDYIYYQVCDLLLEKRFEQSR